MLKALAFVALLAVVTAYWVPYPYQGDHPYPPPGGILSWELNAYETYLLEEVGFYPAGYVDDGVDGWFYMYPGGNTLSIPYLDLIKLSSDGSYRVFTYTLSSLYSGVVVSVNLRLDQSGWAIAFWDFYNPYPTPNNLYLANYGEDDKGSDSNTYVYTTSSGDGYSDGNDRWAISYEGTYQNGFRYLTGDPILITSFNQGGYLDYFYDSSNVNDDYVDWFDTVYVAPYSHTAFLEVLGVVYTYINDPTRTGAIPAQSLQIAINRANNVLGSPTAFQNYLTPAGWYLLDHLTTDQLLSVSNWRFSAAGVGGDPHGISVDMNPFELPNTPAVYCLFADDHTQVNIEVNNVGFVDNVVVFARVLGVRFVANINPSTLSPEYFLDGRKLQVPERLLDGEISTRAAPLHYRSAPLNEMDRYHVSSLQVKGLVTIVGGYHPQIGGFFNVAVHRRTRDSEFPSVLQLPFHPLREVGFSAAVLPDVSFDLQA